MKITQEHYEKLKEKIEEVITGSVFENGTQGLKYYEENNIGKDHKMRFCFDFFYLINQSWRHTFMDEFYEYANDDHLYTALKKILLAN